MEIKGIDIVACVAVGCCSVLVYCGHDGSIISLMATIIGYYFGKKASEKTP